MRGNSTILVLGLLLTIKTRVMAQDSATTLLLSLNNTLIGAQGESPGSSAGVTFDAGMLGAGARLSGSNNLKYLRAGNFDAQEGTYEFWIKPNWPGSDTSTYSFGSCSGGGGGVVFAKDGANNLRAIFNRYSSEVDVALNISNWQAQQWHYVAYTWSLAQRSVKLFVDGVLRDTQALAVGQTLHAVTDQYIFIGSDSGNLGANAVFDEVRISNRPRTDFEVAQRYVSGLTVLGIDVNPSQLNLWKTWRRQLAVTATTNIGVVPIPSALVSWSTENSDVAQIDANNRVVATGPGSTTVTGTLSGVSDSTAVTVQTPVREPEVEVLDSFLTTPAANFMWEMPVLIIRYVPTMDGLTVDSQESGFSGSINSLKNNINRFNNQVKFSLEEGSRFRGFGSQGPKPSLGYRVVKMITVYEPLPPDPLHTAGEGATFPDYAQIVERFGGQSAVMEENVREIWLWGYHTNTIVPAESNMSSPVTGDVSNSNRWNDDLPIYDRTYTLYNYNYTRSSNEAVHNHGHQLEAIYGHTNWLQTGNDHFFWRQFVGFNSSGQFVRGRCGACHFPTNAVQDYDYENPTFALSDCMDWTPGGTGNWTQVNRDTWGDISYNWPYGQIPGGRIEAHFYTFWMQCMPGRGNTIPFGANQLTNWWFLTGDWDSAVRTTSAEFGLYDSMAAITLHPRHARIVSGERFDGDLTSLTASDDRRLIVLNDETSLVAELSFDTVTPRLNPTTSAVLRVETAASRPGLIETLLIRNHATGQFVPVRGRTAPITDTAIQVSFTDPQRNVYISANGLMETRIRWVPVNDEEPTQDGWTHAVDLHRWQIGR